MSKKEVDDYLASLAEPSEPRSRHCGRHSGRCPGVEQGLSYGLLAFRLEGTVIAGFAASKNTSAICPTPIGLPEFRDEIGQVQKSSGALQFAVDTPLPKNARQEARVRQKETSAGPLETRPEERRARLRGQCRRPAHLGRLARGKVNPPCQERSLPPVSDLRRPPESPAQGVTLAMPPKVTNGQDRSNSNR